MKTRFSTLAAAISSAPLLTACGGGGGSGADAVDIVPLKPQVSFSSTPTVATVGVPFDIHWEALNATSCVTSFDSSTATTGTVSRTENSANTYTYTATCTGTGGEGAGTVNVQVNVPVIVNLTAEGLWQGTTGSGRAVAGVVTKEGNYWLVYVPSGGANATGFLAGNMGMTSTNITEGTITSNNLVEVDFASGTAKAGAIPSGIYEAKTTVAAGSLVPVVGSSGTATYGVSGTGQTRQNAGNLLMANQIFTGTGTATITGGVLSSATFNYSANLTSPLDATVNSTLTGTFAFANTTGNYTDTITGCTNQGANITTCNSSLALVGIPQPLTATPFNFSNPASLTWGSVEHGTSVLGPVTTTRTYTATQTSFTPSVGLPGITADTLTLNAYDNAYEDAPSLADIAGQYVALSTGIGSTNNPGATFTVNANGALTLGIDAGSHCAFTATIAAHATGGNVYDVTAMSFTNAGGSCAHIGETFAGVAIFDGINRLTITALNQDRDFGVMIIATK